MKFCLILSLQHALKSTLSDRLRENTDHGKTQYIPYPYTYHSLSGHLRTGQDQLNVIREPAISSTQRYQTPDSSVSRLTARLWTSNGPWTVSLLSKLSKVQGYFTHRLLLLLGLGYYDIYQCPHYTVGLQLDSIMDSVLYSYSSMRCTFVNCGLHRIHVEEWAGTQNAVLERFKSVPKYSVNIGGLKNWMFLTGQM